MFDLIESSDISQSIITLLQFRFILFNVGLKKYIVSTIEQCRALGYVTTIAGRRRYLPMINSTTNRAGRTQAERQAVNTTVQGSAADLVKLATINLQNPLHPGMLLMFVNYD